VRTFIIPSPGPALESETTTEGSRTENSNHAETILRGIPKVHKRYHKPATPCDRLLAHASVSTAAKEALGAELGADQRLGASFDQEASAASHNRLKSEVGSAHITFPRRAVVCAESPGSDVMAWPSLVRAGQLGVRVW
jgi:hypothetical protein